MIAKRQRERVRVGAFTTLRCKCNSCLAQFFGFASGYFLLPGLITWQPAGQREIVDQHEGSVMVGKLLKELFVDSALKRPENLDKENQTHTVEKKEVVN